MTLLERCAMCWLCYVREECSPGAVTVGSDEYPCCGCGKAEQVEASTAPKRWSWLWNLGSLSLESLRAKVADALNRLELAMRKSKPSPVPLPPGRRAMTRDVLEKPQGLCHLWRPRVYLPLYTTLKDGIIPRRDKKDNEASLRAASVVHHGRPVVLQNEKCSRAPEDVARSLRKPRQQLRK